MEVLLAAASEPEPPPLAELVGPELLGQPPADTAGLLDLLPGADVYLQDEVEFALLLTLTRLWMPKGRRNQRLVEAPGNDEKVHGFGLVDWRDGWLDASLAPSRAAQPFREQLGAAVARSQARGRIAIVIRDNARTHTPEGSLKVPGTRPRVLLSEHGGQLRLVYTPKYDPESNRHPGGTRWLWRNSRREVTHNRARADFATLRGDAEAHFERLRGHPEEVLRHIGSPHAPGEDATTPQPLAA